MIHLLKARAMCLQSTPRTLLGHMTLASAADGNNIAGKKRNHTPYNLFNIAFEEEEKPYGNYYINTQN